MKQCIIILILLLNFNYLFAQKQIIDTAAYKKWSIVGNPLLSNNGRYASYSILNLAGYKREKIIIKSTKDSWKQEYTNVQSDVVFTADSKYVLFVSKGDLHIILLGNASSHQVIRNVSDFDVPSGGTGEWLLYHVFAGERNTILKNLKTGDKKEFSGKSFSYFSDEGKALVLQKFINNGGIEKMELEWVDLTNQQNRVIWKGSQIEQIAFDFKHQQFAFKTPYAVWYYKRGMQTADVIVGHNSPGIDHSTTVGTLGKFTNDGSHLFFELQKRETFIANMDEHSAAIWSYMDIKLQNRQEAEIKDKQKSKLTFSYSVNLSNHNLVSLSQFGNEIMWFNGLSDYVISSHQADDGSRELWRAGYGWSNDLINIKTGERILLDSILGQKLVKPNFSPKGNLFVFFDEKLQNYFSYNFLSGKSSNLTTNIQTSWYDINVSDEPDGPHPRGIAGWANDGSSVLIYDKYDIWKIDLEGIHTPVNVTNHFGKKNNIVFSLTEFNNEQQSFQKNTKLILTAFNQNNKDNGFFSKNIDEVDDPELLTMGAYIYDIASPYINVEGGSEGRIIKSKNSNQFLIRRMNAFQAPNYFLSKDLKVFTSLSDVNPHKEYNWYTTELCTWPSLDGSQLQGILYKPENFDPNKKYPVIIHYYERKTDGLNAFLFPEFSQGNIDIPTYVSQGYLVFSPDIYYRVGDPMQGSYDAIVSAANYLAKLPFVNQAKIGIQGHSFGGIQTNYLVSHTKLFAAACSASGIANWVSGYTTINDRGDDPTDVYERGQLRMGTSLFENLNGYIKNSAIMHVDNVSTPFLLMHTKKDDACPYSNVLEFFLALRRLGKKAWLVAYPDADHALSGNDAKDFTIRMHQFFDHYLRDKPAPVWMTRGLAASSRGLYAGIEYDLDIKTPGPGLLKKEEQAQVDSLTRRKTITITLK